MIHVAVNPTHGEITAMVIQTKGDGFFGESYFLHIMNSLDSTSLRVNRELLEGRGGYESAVLGVRWLTSDDLLVERVLDDRRQNMIYSISKVRFQLVGDSLSTSIGEK